MEGGCWTRAERVVNDEETEKSNSEISDFKKRGETYALRRKKQNNQREMS